MSNHSQSLDPAGALSALNLNLLPALDALLRERNVSTAARRVGVSQSAMSHSLAKLRLALGDPLLVAAGRRMAPTPRAESLARSLPPLLAALHAALAQPESFDPKLATRAFRIATFDLFEFTILPDLLVYLREHAPNVRLHIERIDERAPQRLADGELDLVLGGETMNMPSSAMRRTVYRDPFACIVRADHPGVGSRMTLKRYLALDHVLISVEGRADGVVDRALAAQQKSRHVALRLPHFSTAALSIQRTDMVCTLARSVAERARELYGVRVLKPPLELPTSAAVAWWPGQHQEDEAHRWFRTLLLDGDALSASLRRLASAG
ncbi:MAG: LysR family transcriptional regulator [Polyangiales bacterium]